MSSQLYFRQLQSGRDFAIGDQMARQMLNFVYVIGDYETKEAVLVDPAYNPKELLQLVEADGFNVTGVVGTHYHFDHVGGSMRGIAEVPGIAELLAEIDVPIHLQHQEVPWVSRATGVSESALVGHDSDDEIYVGAIPIKLLHTPGHTPGSQCLLVDECLITGDTLFLEGCGRTDLPGSDVEEMYTTLSQRLTQISGSTRVYPGHRYSTEPSATMQEVRHDNFVLAPYSKEQWLAMFGN